ncbi:MAG: beta-L-arabinofuranosidase domain-containing protein, partial [Vicinamibacterales bacterium]
MITRVFVTFVLAVSTVLLALGHATDGQGGDQFLDGIGETGLVARYVLNGNAEDASRNNFHATVRGSGGTFVEDGPRRTLLLTGDGSHLELPGNALAGEDTVSITGWLFLPTGATGHVFDFGQNASNRLFAEAGKAGFRAAIVSDGTVRGDTPARPVLENQWLHFAVVLDPARRVLTTYLDGARAAQAPDVSVNATQIVSQTDENANRLFVGRSQVDSEPALHGRLRDVRIYRIALTDEQVGTIRRNALAARQTTRGRGAPPPVISTANIPKESWLASRLSHVPDITVETTVGMLPRLPTTIPAVYRGNSKGGAVRVIWPAPADNSDVKAPGSHVVTGKVPGTTFEPKATVIVKVPIGTTTPPSRLAEAFPLSQVALDPDTTGRPTAFIKNRDKFIEGLAASNPDNFLYNFRDAFGEPQPAGTEQLEGWDNQTTRLRGHASGHYLTAIAQAYASTTYDEALRAHFLGKMNYLIDTLYDLSRKSGRPATAGGASVADPTAVPPGPDRKGYDSNLRAGAIRTDYWTWGVGFISGYPPDQFIMLEKGATYGTQDTQIWAPYYTLHKILAGLLDSYEVAGNKKALDVARGMGAWTYARLRALPPETRTSMWSRYIAGEYGGMNEVMARLFRLTGDRQFLDGAKLFDNT